jgi:hypothetical protein
MKIKKREGGCFGALSITKGGTKKFGFSDERTRTGKTS